MKLEQIAQTNTHERIWTIDWYPPIHPGTHMHKCSQQQASHAPSNYGLSLNNTTSLSMYAHLEPGRNTNRSYQIHTQIEVQPPRQKFCHCIFRRHHLHLRQRIGYLLAVGLAIGSSKRSNPYHSKVKAVDWSPNDQKLVSCSRDKNLWVWTYNSTICDYECETVLEGHTEDIKAVIWLENDVLASCSYDTTVRIWAEDDG